jgi:hypothetical protein
MRPPIQNTLTHFPPPLPKHHARPLRQCETPMPSNQYTTNNIHNLNHKPQKTIPALLNRKQHRLNIILEEYAGDLTFTDNG